MQKINFSKINLFNFLKRKKRIPSIADMRIYYGLPRNGKTYCAADDILGNLNNKKFNECIKTFTNWPVKSPDTGECTYMLKDRWDLLDIDSDADVYIDEAHFWYNSRLWLNKNEGMKKDEMNFYRTLGHNNIRVTCITHHPDRLDVNIRSICTTFRRVMKKNWPIINRLKSDFQPRAFIIEDYLSESDMGGLIPKIAHEEIRYFDKGVANAYDTHYFRNEKIEKTYLKWGENKDGDMEKKKE
jgi:hypothetical protein